ncbi:MAG: FAD-dependent oxidoreductase, partial [Desulfobacterales bacterium]
MHAIKEALLAGEKTGQALETAIYHMDMRTLGKSFQRYREQAETQHGVRFERARVHSVVRDAKSGSLILRSVNLAGAVCEEPFDLVVLAVGQRPAAGAAALAEELDIRLNPWGFGQTEPFSLTRTRRPGITLGGSFSGLTDISESVIQASAAALNASRVIHSAGGSLALEETPPPAAPADPRELPRILVVVCTCGDKMTAAIDCEELARRLTADPHVDRVEFLARICTAHGWEQLAALVQKSGPNRLLIGTCHAYGYRRKLKELGVQVGPDSGFMEVVDRRQSALAHGAGREAQSRSRALNLQLAALQMGIAKLKWVDPERGPEIRVHQSALVVGGGIAGMTAALAIADHGFQVDLVEQTENLGGNLSWLQRTLDGHAPVTLLEDTRAAVAKHPRIRVHTRSRVSASEGQVGHFQTLIEDEQGAAHVVEHGVVVLATGGVEATTTAYGYGSTPAVVTQKELEQQLNDKRIDPGRLNTVVMIQCVDSREEPRNYCSRVCCATALKHALHLKEQNPAVTVYVLYRDMMSYGFKETYYTRARQAGVVFIPYQRDGKPRVHSNAEALQVEIRESIIGQTLWIDTDLVVLATGIVPQLPRALVEAFGASLDQDGFFQEAEYKWRPV